MNNQNMSNKRNAEEMGPNVEDMLERNVHTKQFRCFPQKSYPYTFFRKKHIHKARFVFEKLKTFLWVLDVLHR